MSVHDTHQYNSSSILSHAGCIGANEIRPPNGAVVDPITLSSTFKRASDLSLVGHNYSRLSNPNRSSLESMMCKLEYGNLENEVQSFAFSSGMQAAQALITTFGKAHYILPVLLI